jgi:H+/Cl- antiporter ClcA
MKTKILTVIKHKLLERHFEESLLFIVIGLLSAVVCASYALIFAVVEKSSAQIFHSHISVAFILAPLAMIGSLLLVKYFAPGSSGSGIPQVLACIEFQDESLARKYLRKTVIVMKILSSFLGVFAGAAIGREGPSLQVAAAIGYTSGKYSEKFFGLKVKVEQLIIAGAAGGLSAAFNTPIGGIVYAIEELSKEHVRNFRDVLLLSVVISGLTAQAISGNYLYLGYPSVPSDNTLWSLFLVLITAGLAGILGGLFSVSLLGLIRWRSSLTLKKQVLIAGAIGLIFACAFHFLGPRNIYSGKESINAILFANAGVPWYEAVSRSIMPVLSSMTGIAGGVFAPALSAGATFGGLVAGIVDPELQVILGLAGMVGFLTGVTHTPITSFILVLEMSDRHAVVFPMMLAALSASIGTHMISGHSFYEEMMHRFYKKEEAINLKEQISTR